MHLVVGEVVYLSISCSGAVHPPSRSGLMELHYETMRTERICREQPVAGRALKKQTLQGTGTGSGLPTYSAAWPPNLPGSWPPPYERKRLSPSIHRCLEDVSVLTRLLASGRRRRSAPRIRCRRSCPAWTGRLGVDRTASPEDGRNGCGMAWSGEGSATSLMAIPETLVMSCRATHAHTI